MTHKTHLAATAILALCLAACGGSGGTTDGTTEPGPAPAPTPAPPTAPAVVPSDVFASLPAPYNDANYAVGQRTWRLCSSCHVFEEGAPHRIGPNLHRMFGSPVGAKADFPYSDALIEADFIWTPERLDEWLTNPSGFLPGNRMTFAGVRKPEDRNAVIAYLMVESGWQPEE